MPELTFRVHDRAGAEASVAITVSVGAEPQPASFFVAADGSDSNPGTAAAPFRTLNKAYQAANPGQVVEVAGGMYPEQTVNAKASAAAPNVIFRPAQGASVQIGTDPTSDDLEVYGDFITFEDMAIFDNWYARDGTRGLVFRNIRAQKFYARSVDGLEILGGSYISPEATGVPTVSATGSGFPPSRNVLMEDVLFERIWRPQGDTTSHREGLHVMGVEGLTMRRCIFREILGNTAALSFNIHHSSVIRGVLLEDCLIEGTYGGGAYPQPTGTGPSVNISDRAPGYELTFRRLRSRDGSPVVPQGHPEYAGAIRFEECVFAAHPNMGLAASEYVWDYTIEAA